MTTATITAITRVTTLEAQLAQVVLYRAMFKAVQQEAEPTSAKRPYDQ